MDGIVIINKPKGVTSHDIVYKVKKLFKNKVGHAGTLDPNATGVLPLLVGKGTLLSKYLINHDKIYEVTLKLGKKTDTADSEGKVVLQEDVNYKILEKDHVNKIIKSFLGKQHQIPPMYSAIKVNGKKLYEYAREGQEIKREKREIIIYNIELISINNKLNEICFKVACSKGTYIRTLCEDIAFKLGSIGYMKELNRLKVGEFDIENAVSIEVLEENCKNINFLKNNIITIEKFFSKFPKVNLNNNLLKKFLNGVKIPFKVNSKIYRVYSENNVFIGIAVTENNFLKRDIII